LSFFERAWASRRTEVSVFDVVPVLELVRAQPFDKVYPSDLYTVRDLASAIRRSVHAYDVVPIIDYVLISRVPAVHAYDIVPTYDWAYVARRNIVHAYDVIAQLDAVDKSGNVTLSATDILSTPEWFFRVNRALKIFETYILYELATASAVPTIFAKDLSVVYDLVASINTIKTVYAFDKLVADSISYTKSYSPLFFSLFQRRVPIVYKTLSVIDVLAVADSLSITVVKTVPASDYVVFDSVAYTKSYSPLFFSLFQRRVPIVYKTLSVLDVVTVADYVDVKNIAVSVSDYVMYDYVPSMSPSDIRYRSLYANVGMRIISVFDRITPYESVRVVPRAVHAYDIVVVWENVNIVRL